MHGELKHINFDNVIMYPTSMHTLRTMYPAILPTPWIARGYWNSDRWKDKPYYKNFINHKVYLFVEKEPGHSYEIQNGEVVFKNQCCLIVDSGKTVRDGINNEDKSVDFGIYTNSLKDTVEKVRFDSN